MIYTEKKKIYDRAVKIYESDLEWDIKYGLIFSNDISQKFDFEWYDPDTSYEDDVIAFMSAFTKYMEQQIYIENL